jgi:alkylation response protein AidB-like acyl-CoA dehydrogenase
MIADLLPTEDQSMIEAAVAGFLADRLPPARLRDAAAGGGAAERAAWPGLAEIGLFGLGLSEAAGGVGYGLPEEIIAARELGRSLASTTVLATMLAAHLLDDDPAGLEALKSGAARAAFANRIEGDEVQLVDAEGARHLVAWDEAGARLLPAASARERAVRPAMDATIALERARLDQGAARSAGPALALRADLYACAYLAGIAEGTTAMAVDYAKTRRQFDQPIGAFQAIKHACADMAVRTEAARAQTFYAALSLEAGEAEAPAEVAAARLIARRAAIENAKANIQIHGAMGFTQETEAHLFLKRAHLMAALNGSLAGDLARLRP